MSAHTCIREVAANGDLSEEGTKVKIASLKEEILRTKHLLSTTYAAWSEAGDMMEVLNNMAGGFAFTSEMEAFVYMPATLLSRTKEEGAKTKLQCCYIGITLYTARMTAIWNYGHDGEDTTLVDYTFSLTEGYRKEASDG
jgi:hypothetical protein